MQETNQEIPLGKLFSPLSSLKTARWIMLIGIIVYINSLFNGFVWDDTGQIINNTKAHSINNISSFFQGGTFDPGNNVDKLSGPYYRPLMTICFSLIYQIFGQNPFYFHLFQLSLHLINTILVFFLFSQFFKKNISFFLSLVFLVHPVNIESVSYIAALSYVLFFFFGVLSLNLSVLLMKTPLKHKFLSTFTIFILLLSSALSNETGLLFSVTLPLFIYLNRRKYFFRVFIASLASLGTYFYLRIFIGKLLLENAGSLISNQPLTIRMLSIPKIIMYYISSFFTANNLTVGQMWVVKHMTFQDFYFPLLGVIIFFLLIFSLPFSLFKTTQKLFNTYLFFIIWFCLGIGLYLQIIPLDMTVSNRWFYFPMLGILGILGSVFSSINFKNKKVSVIIQIISILIIVGLSVRTIVRNKDWNSSYSLFSRDILDDNNNFYLHHKLAVQLDVLNKYNEAEKHFLTSIKLNPTASAYSSLGLVYFQKGDNAKAKRNYFKALKIDKKYYPAYLNLAYLLFKTNEYMSAKNIAMEGVKISSNSSDLWTILGISEYKLNNRQPALNAIKKAYTISPNNYLQKIYEDMYNGQSVDTNI